MVKARSIPSTVKPNVAAPSNGRKRQKEPSPEEYLDSDSEVDEWAENYQSSDGEGGSGSESGGEDFGSEEEEEEGTAKWEPDQWDENASDSEGSGSGSEEEEDEQAELRRLQSDLGSLPLSTLAKAQKAIKAQRSSSSSSQSSKEDRLLSVKAKLAQMQKGKGKAGGVTTSHGSAGARGTEDDDEDEDEDSDSDAPEAVSTKRGNKHAPQAMSTKRQVTRHRQVVDIHKPERRDPRFSSVSAGSVDAHLHSQSYSFLPSILKDEVSSLKKALSAALKAEKTCPWSEKPARTAERERLEIQLGKVRTRLVRNDRDQAERDVLAKVKKEEREKRAQGKGAWFMKKGEKRDLLLKARFESLEKRGGKNAVKKAIEKKRKKVAGKEKKSRPFAPGQGGSGSGAGAGGDKGGERKRQRV